MGKIIRVILYSILTVAFVGAFGIWLANHNRFGTQLTADFTTPFGMAIGLALVAYAIHAGILLMLRRFSTRVARWVPVTLFITLPLFGTLLLVALGLENVDFQEASFGFLTFLLASLGFFLVFPGLIVYSMPSSLPATLPLLAHYLFLSTFSAFLSQSILAYSRAFPQLILLQTPVLFYVIYLTLAGYLFPTHRRLREFWAPSRLPRRVVERKGFTLIELLIVVAMMSILLFAITNMTGNTHRLVERQANWRAAVALAEEQFDLLRARGRLPGLGRHPIDQEIANHFPIAGHAELEVIAGPRERFREVRIHVRLRGEANAKLVSLAAILPADEVKP